MLEIVSHLNAETLIREKRVVFPRPQYANNGPVLSPDRAMSQTKIPTQQVTHSQDLATSMP